MKKKTIMKRGFTLIEVVIVLAIAALIMVVVFLAVTGAQRAQRDQERKDVANRVLAAMSTARGNRGGAAADAATISGYFQPAELNGLTVTDGGACNGITEVAMLWGATAADDAVFVGLESNDCYQAQ